MRYFTAEYDALTTKQKISALEVELNKQYITKQQEEVSAATIIEADTNAFNAMYDGIKNVFTQENAILFVSPMKCMANAFYKTVVNDGIKDIVNYFVCMPEDASIKTPIVTTENFDEYMEPWDLA